MSDSTLKIFACYYKPADRIDDDVYVPLHVGRSVSPFKEEMKDMVGDDTGDNISEKNIWYNELTGVYWIWKNIHDVKYVGICSYRRQYGISISQDNIEGFFQDGTEAIMSQKGFYPHNRLRGLMMSVQTEDVLILWGVMKNKCPQYLPSLLHYFNSYFSYNYHMVICKKELFDRYAEWMFDILFEFEKYYKPSAYSNAKRAIGYLGEVLMPVFFLHNNCRIKEVPRVFEGKVLPPFSTKWKIVRWILQNLVFPFTKDKFPTIDPSIYRGLACDGIDIDCTMSF